MILNDVQLTGLVRCRTEQCAATYESRLLVRTVQTFGSLQQITIPDSQDVPSDWHRVVFLGDLKLFCPACWNDTFERTSDG